MVEMISLQMIIYSKYPTTIHLIALNTFDDISIVLMQSDNAIFCMFVGLFNHCR
nr:hypothetical protein B11C_100020 [Bartonella sp. 1-1C]